MAGYNTGGGYPPGDGGGGGGGNMFQFGGMGGGGAGEMPDGYRGRGRPLHRRPVTDYGSSVAKFVMARTMGWRGMGGNQMRPAAPWVIDVSANQQAGENLRGDQRRLLERVLG